jgi:hypothetical protein
MKCHRGLLASVAWLLAASMVSAQSAEDAVKAVPSGALGFVVINNIGEVSKKVDALAKRVGNPLPFTLLDKFKTDTGIDKGLNTDGSAMVVFLMSGGGQPSPVGFLPVSNYGDFVGALGGKADGDISEVKLANGTQLVVGKKGSFALLTEQRYRDALEAAVKATPSGGSLASVQPWVVGNDISGVLPSSTVQMVSMLGRQGLGMAKGFADNVPAEFKFVVGWLDALDTFLQSIGTDVNSLGVGGRIDQAGNLALGLQALFVKDSGFAKAGAAAQPPAGGALAGLPNISYVFALGGGMSEKTMSGLMQIGNQMLSAAAKDVPPEKLKKLESISTDMVKGLRSMSMLMGSGKAKQPLFETLYAVMHTADSQAYLDHYKKYIDVYNEVAKDLKFGNGLIPNQTMKAKSVTVEGLPALEVQAELIGVENMPEQQQKFMKLYVGPDNKFTVTTVAIDKHTLLLRYTSPDNMKPFLQSYRAKADGLAGEANVAKTTALLPANPQWLAVISPAGAVDMANHVLSLAMPGMQIPRFPQTPPLGVGCKLSADGLESRLVVPAGTLQAIGAYARQLKQMQGAGAGVQ